MSFQTGLTGELRSNESRPLLDNFLKNHQDHHQRTSSHGGESGGHDGEIDCDDETSSVFSMVRWTTCDEIKRCTCAVFSFVAMASLVGTALVLFWFLWAWFVLWLDLPGVLTPIVWLCGFLAPLCMFRLFTLCPRCTRGCCSDPLTPPELNAWKAYHLWNERRLHVEAIVKTVPSLPYQLGEMISDYCFHSDILVTSHKNKLVGIYPDSASAHTVAEFTQSITDFQIPGGNIRNVYVLVRREQEQIANSFRNSLGLDGPAIVGGADNLDPASMAASAARRNGGICASLAGLCMDSTAFADLMICEFDLAKGKLLCASNQFIFEQLSNSTMQQLKGIYYEPVYRLLYDNDRKRLIASRDGEYVLFDMNLNRLMRRELIARPENGDDREQFLHLREYKWNSSVIVPPSIVRHVIAVVDAVERTESSQLINDDDVYCMVPFGDHALFVGNVSTGWLRYLDFSHVDPISHSEIHHIEFSQDCQYMYLCLTQTLALMNIKNFQPLLTVPYTHLDYTIPCGVVRLPPEQLQVQQMRRYYQRKARELQRAMSDSSSTSGGGDHHQGHLQSSAHDTSILSGLGGESFTSLDESGRVVDESVHSDHPGGEEANPSPSYDELRQKLESVCILFASTRVLVDPRTFLYRFPANKCRVVTRTKNRWSKGGRGHRELFDGNWLLDRYQSAGSGPNGGTVSGSSDKSQGGWQYVSLKHRPWKFHPDGSKNRSSSSHSSKKPRKVNQISLKVDKDEDNGSEVNRFVAGLQV